MTSYRCAACGSANVMTDTQAGGVSYDYKKGIIGTVILGTGGAIAGVSSKTQTVYKCADCGMCLTYSMPDDLRLAIDLGVDNADMRDQLHLRNNNRLSWSRLKQLYKNIESGAGDKQIERETKIHHNNLLSYATASQEAFDNAVDVLAEYENRMENYPEVLTLTEYYVWQDALYTFIENAAKYIPQTPPEKYRNLNLGRQDKVRPNHRAPRLLRYFFTYFVIKAYEEYKTPLTSADFRNYADYEPFILWFVNWFFPHYFEPLGEREGSIVPWTLSDFLWICTYGVTYGPRILVSKELFVEIDDYSLHLGYVPPYVVSNGILGYWLYSDKKRLGSKELLEDYFRYNPEKKIEYDERVSDFLAKQKSFSADIAKCKDKIKFHEEKINALERQIARNNSSIEEKRSQIEPLRKKIFGKKAARAEAEKLEQQIQEILAENDQAKHEKEKHTQEISTNKKAITKREAKEKRQNDEKEKFFKTIARDMDYFIFWRWDSDAFREMLLEKETAENGRNELP